MIEQLQRAVNMMATLPADEQAHYAAHFFEMMESDHRWDESFGKSQDALSQLADEALREDAAGRTEDADRLFP